MHRARKRFGQNFLIDPEIIHTIVSKISPKPNDHILEIGPGLGALTSPLLTKTTQLEVIEIDHDLIEELRNLNNHHLTIHQGDALDFDFSTHKQTRRIVGNLPYNISTPLIFHLLEHLPYIQDMHFMLQKEVVDRICAQSGERNFGRFSVMVQAQCKTTKLFEVTPEKFSPTPKITSAFICLTPHKEPVIPDELKLKFAQTVKNAFSQPRKTLANNLKKQLSSQDIERAGIDSSLRPQYLTIAQLIQLSQL